MIPDESYIDYKYRRAIFASCSTPPVEILNRSVTTYKMECPLCNAKGAHLVWMAHKRTWKFLCSTKGAKNCWKQLEFPHLIRQWNEDLHLVYLQERFEAGTAGAGFNVPLPSAQHRKREPLRFMGSVERQDQNQPTGIGSTAF